MSEKISRLLLILESILIVAPFTLLALAYVYLSLASFFEFSASPYMIALAVLALLSLAAFGSGWRLLIAFLQGGTEKLKQQHPFWSVMIGAGVLILFGSIASRLLPPSPEYSMWWSFRLEFDLFALCTPVLIPLSHLAAERILRTP